MLRVQFALLIFFAMASTASAQVLYGSLVGNVTDETKSVAKGAEVTTSNQQTNLTRRVLTNEEGQFAFSNLPSGTYSIKVRLSGFSDYERAGIAVAVNSTVREDVTLHVAGVQSTVTVNATGGEAPLQADRSDIRREILTRDFEELPVSLAGNYQSLLNTLPGFESDADFRPARMGGCNPSGSVAFSVNGATTSTTVTNVDGASNSHIWNVGRSAVVPTIDSIESLNVTTNSFDAEQGLAGGAVINVQSKGGTNQFHGSLFETHYNQHMKARDYFRPAGQEKGKYISNRFGGTIGGPIKRNKLFFFTSYGALRQRENGSDTFSVPSPAVRAGDYSAFANIIYDPATGTPDGAGRIPFPDNKLPANRIDPIARKITDLVPLGNLPGLVDANANNFFASRPFSADRWNLDSKVNWQASSKFNAFASWNYAHHQAKHLTAFGEGYIDGRRVGGGNAGDAWGYNNRISAGANYILSPTLLMDVFAGWTRQNTNVEQVGIGTNFGLDVLHIPGTNGPERFQSGWPRFVVSGFTGFGTEEAYSPYYRNDNQYSIRSNFTKMKGVHELRWGVDINSEQMNHKQPEFQGGASTGPRGLFNFGTGVTSACLAPDGLGGCTRVSATTSASNAFASFLLGLPNQVGKNLLTTFPYTTRTWRYSLYARDRWQANSKLTINYGLRWEYFPMPTRAGRGFERYDPTDNKMHIGGVGNIPADLGVTTSHKLFAPRFGFAYRLKQDSVVRGGYGISYDPYSLARALRTNHPILIELVVPSANALVESSKLSDGIPAIAVPSLGNGIIDVPSNVSTQTVPIDFHRGYLQSWNLTLQKRLGHGFVGEAGYVATRQIRQLGYRQLNWSPVNGGTNGRALFQRFGRSADTRDVGPIGGSHYDSLQASVQRRFTRWYSFTGAYTFAKSISGSGLDRSDSTLKIVIPEYYSLNRSISALVRRHNLQMTNVTALPFGKGKPFLNNGGIAASILGNWQANSIVSILSGRPFSVTASATSLNAPGSTQRADQVKPDVEILGGVGRGSPYFDPLAFKNVTDARFGTAGFNSLIGPGRFNWDLSLFRYFRLREKIRVEARGEAFNLTNTPKFGLPGANVGNLQLNPDGTVRNLNGFAEITSATEERQLSVSFRITF